MRGSRRVLGRAQRRQQRLHQLLQRWSAACKVLPGFVGRSQRPPIAISQLERRALAGCFESTAALLAAEEFGGGAVTACKARARSRDQTPDLQPGRVALLPWRPFQGSAPELEYGLVAGSD